MVADPFGVPAADVATDRPVSGAPLRGDELDLVEPVMELEVEDRFRVALTDEALEPRVDSTPRFDPTRITAGPRPRNDRAMSQHAPDWAVAHVARTAHAQVKRQKQRCANQRTVATATPII